jgi:RNA 2',3'-cyclic 3'-phosphodiesterase
VSRQASVAGRERLRLFCALRLPPDVLDELEAWSGRHLTERVVPRSNLHITIAFLGHRAAEELAGIAAALAEAARESAAIVLEPERYRETRTVGMIVLRDENFAARGLADGLFDRLEALGVYERERRPWLPHVTVVRFRRPPGLRPPLPALGRFGPSDAAVYLSRLSPSGAQYEVVESFALGG